MEIMGQSKDSMGSTELVQVTTSIAPHTRSLEVANEQWIYPPLPLLRAPTTPISEDEQIGGGESSHTITIPEPHICRICDPEDDNDDVLVELGCSCKDQLSKMHRKCIIEWFGARMLVQKVNDCEVCKKSVGDEAQLAVAQAVSDHENGGRAILMRAVKKALGPSAAFIKVDGATNFEELVQLLLDHQADILPQTVMISRNFQRRQNIVCWTVIVVILLVLVSSAYRLYLHIIHMPAPGENIRFH